MGNTAAVKRQCMSLADFFGGDEVEGQEGRVQPTTATATTARKNTRTAKPSVPQEGEDLESEQAEAATKLQAAWRGKKARDTFRSLKEEAEQPSSDHEEGPGFSGYDAYPEPEPENEPQFEKFDPSKQKEDHAAAKIQAVFRGRKVRKENDIQKMKGEQLWAATKIQAAYRGHQVRQAGELEHKRNRWVHFQEDSARGVDFVRWNKNAKHSKCTVKIDWSGGKLGGKNVPSINLTKGYQVVVGKHTEVMQEVPDSKASASTCFSVVAGKKSVHLQAVNQRMRDHFAWGLGQMMLRKSWQ